MPHANNCLNSPNEDITKINKKEREKCDICKSFCEKR
jgi:hypothetical protein